MDEKFQFSVYFICVDFLVHDSGTEHCVIPGECTNYLQDLNSLTEQATLLQHTTTKSPQNPEPKPTLTPTTQARSHLKTQNQPTLTPTTQPRSHLKTHVISKPHKDKQHTHLQHTS